MGKAFGDHGGAEFARQQLRGLLAAWSIALGFNRTDCKIYIRVDCWE